jgi:hypothetical protein
VAPQTALDDGGDHALAHTGALASLRPARGCVWPSSPARDERIVERRQPAQVDHAHLPAVLCLDLRARAQAIGTPLPKVKITRSFAASL